jgi:hypothetical protein
MYNTGDTSGTNYKTKRSYSEGKREGKNVFYIEKRAFLCGELFFFRLPKKGIAMH